MGNMHLVTGYAGQPHVTAPDQGSFNAAMFGAGQYVLNRGNQLAASVITNNNVRISDGDIMMQGRHIRIAEGYVDLTIENGAQGKKRNDLIVARYTKDSITGVEDVNLVVIKGTAVDSNPVDPEYTNGDILNGNALLNDMPIYRLPLDGLNVGTPVALFDVFDFADHTHMADDLNATLLWEGTWSSGSITVNGLSDYSVALLTTTATDNSKVIILVGITEDGLISGGALGAAGNYTGTTRLAFTKAGDTLKMNNIKYNNLWSGDYSSKSIAAIYGLFGR